MKEWLGLKAISKEYADLSERTLRKYLGDPVHPLPARVIGGKLLVARSDLDAWLRSFPRDREGVDRLVDEIIAEIQTGGNHG
jgi:hypothetical protein